jgi:putative phage-type endonuclease
MTTATPTGYLIDRCLNRGLEPKEIVQCLRHVVDDIVNVDMVERRQLVRSTMSTVVAALPKGIPQRTPDWYAARELLITASNFKEAASRPESFIKKKLDPKPFKGSDATRWGVKYEEVANLLYSHYNQTTVLEYGLLIHPTIKHLGASPDGVTPYGVMIEIKCPYSKTLSDIPPEYWGQMQGQMEVTKLTECDFVVCRVVEINESEFWTALEDPVLDRARYGVVAQDQSDDSFVYSRPDMTNDEIVAFVSGNSTKYITYHRVFKFTSSRVLKDEEEWKITEERLLRTWTILSDMIGPKTTEPGVQQPTETTACSFKQF